MSSSECHGVDGIESSRHPPRNVLQVVEASPAATFCGVSDVEAVVGPPMSTFIAVEGSGATAKAPLQKHTQCPWYPQAVGVMAVWAPLGFRGRGCYKSASLTWAAAEKRHCSAPVEQSASVGSLYSV